MMPACTVEYECLLGRAQVGALGSALPDQGFDCPSCSRPLTGADVFSLAALAQAEGQALGAAAAAATAGSAGPGSAAAGSVQAEGAGCPSSAKIQHMLRLLTDIRQRNDGREAG